MTRLDIISDPICPWCYIGKSHLDRALEAHPDHDFQIEWHPFQLNPDMPPEGVDRTAYLEWKFGGPDGAKQVYGRIAQAAEVAGLEIDFDRISRTPSTIDAHRVIHWAGLEGVQTPVVSGLFRAYFRDGRDIGDADVLSDVAAAAGMDRQMTRTLLEGEADIDDIRARDAHARERGVQGVPCFIVDQAYAVQGAQPPEVWANVIRELAEKKVR